MMAEQKEQFEINGKKFQIIEVKEAEQQSDYSHLVGKWFKIIPNERVDASYHGKWVMLWGFDEHGYPKFVNNELDALVFTEYLSGWDEPHLCFDLSNPSDTNPDEKKVWEKANEDMWEYFACFIADETPSDISIELNYLITKSRHVSAYLFLSKFADLCNEGRVVDWMDYTYRKCVVNAYKNNLKQESYTGTLHKIAFLDEEARDYSLKVHEQIWKDYWGIE